MGYVGSAARLRPFALPGIEPVVLAGPFLSWIGIRQLAASHVIAGPSLGRIMALHGGPTRSTWRTSDVEHSLWHYTSHVGMRSTMP